MIRIPMMKANTSRRRVQDSKVGIKKKETSIYVKDGERLITRLWLPAS